MTTQRDGRSKPPVSHTDKVSKLEASLILVHDQTAEFSKDRVQPFVRMRSAGSHIGENDNATPILRTRSAGSQIGGDEKPRSILRTRSSGSQVAGEDQPLFLRAASADSVRSRASFAELPPIVFRIRKEAECSIDSDAHGVNRDQRQRSPSVESRRSSRRSSIQTR